MVTGTEIAYCPLFVPAELIRRVRELEREVAGLRTRANIEFMPPFHVDSIPSHSTTVSIQCVQELSSDLQTIDISDTGGSITNIDTIDPLIITNTRGSTIEQFGIVGLGEGTTSPQDDYATFADAVYVDSAAPGTGTRFAIVLKEVANGYTSPAVAAGGPVQVQVNRSITSHDYAGSTSGNYDYLTSGTSGYAEIMSIDDLPAAAIGEVVYEGAGVPSGGLGANGDYYKDTAASEYYGPKTAGAWGSAHDYGTGICWAVVTIDITNAITSINGETGPAITLQSAGSTVLITTSSSNVINLEGSGIFSIDSPNSTVTVTTEPGVVHLVARVATNSVSGIVSTLTQNFLGTKTFQTGSIDWTPHRALYYELGGTIGESAVGAFARPNNATLIGPEYSGDYLKFGASLISFRSGTTNRQATIEAQLLPRGNTGILDDALRDGAFVLNTMDANESDLVEGQEYKPVFAICTRYHDAVGLTSSIYLGQWGTVAGLTFTGGLMTGGTFLVTVPSGGTGATSFTANQLIFGNGTDPLEPLEGTKIVADKLQLKGDDTDDWWQILPSETF